MRYMCETILDAVDAADASHTSAGIDANQMEALSVGVVASGSPVGVVKVQASNLPIHVVPGASDSSWVDLASATVAVSAAGAFLIPITYICYRWVRVVYTKTSGTGAITAHIKTISV